MVTRRIIYVIPKEQLANLLGGHWEWRGERMALRLVGQRGFDSSHSTVYLSDYVLPTTEFASPYGRVGIAQVGTLAELQVDFAFNMQSASHVLDALAKQYEL